MTYDGTQESGKTNIDTWFGDRAVNRDILRKRAYNYRWAEQAEDVIPLTAADPDFPAAPVIRQAIIEYAKDGYFSYGPKTGLDEFRQAASRVMKQRKGIHVPPSRILPIDSAARAMFVMAQTLLFPGDQAIIFDPVDYLFKSSIEAAGAEALLCPVDLSNGEIDFDLLASLVTPKTRMLGVCNAHNPLGRVLRPGEVRQLAELAAKHDLWIMNDEIWSDIVYEDENIVFSSIHALEEELTKRTVTIYGFSKTFSMAGLRAAFMMCPNDDIYQRFVDASDMMSTAGGLSPIVQVGATAALNDGWEWAASFVQHLKGQRDYALSRIAEMPGINCNRPEGTYVLFPDIRGTGLGSEDFVDQLLDEAKLALVPGTPKFFGPGAEGHVRICYATSREILSEGLDRLEHWLMQRRTR